MKKEYIAPEITIAEYTNRSYMLSVSAGDIGVGYGGEATGLDADARGRRGKWGDLWEE